MHGTKPDSGRQRITHMKGLGPPRAFSARKTTHRSPASTRCPRGSKPRVGGRPKLRVFIALVALNPGSGGGRNSGLGSKDNTKEKKNAEKTRTRRSHRFENGGGISTCSPSIRKHPDTHARVKRSYLAPVDVSHLSLERAAPQTSEKTMSAPRRYMRAERGGCFGGPVTP